MERVLVNWWAYTWGEAYIRRYNVYRTSGSRVLLVVCGLRSTKLVNIHSSQVQVRVAKDYGKTKYSLLADLSPPTPTPWRNCPHRGGGQEQQLCYRRLDKI